MRINVYSEEITQKVEIVSKQGDGKTFVGVRFYTELPVTLGTSQVSGPFLHHPGDDDSAAITFWGPKRTKEMLTRALQLLEKWELNQAYGKFGQNQATDAKGMTPIRDDSSLG